MKRSVYLDYAAATPVDPHVVEAMKPFFRDIFQNPSARYRSAEYAHKVLEQLRKYVASTFGIRSNGVTFTAGVTEANNLFLYGLAAQYKDAHFLVSAVEHDSIRHVLDQLADVFSISYDTIDVDERGRLNLEDLERKIKDNTVAVSIIYVNNETGVIQNLSDISHVIDQARRKRKKQSLPLYFHTDAAQAPMYAATQIDRLGVDAMSVNAAKIYGPKQAGALLTVPGVSLVPLISGGGQEHGLRGGTENLAAIAGFTKALERVNDIKQHEQDRLTQLQAELEQFIKEEVEDAVINGDQANRSPHISSVTLPGIDGERLLLALDEQEIQVATGAACSAADEEPSRVLQAMGRSREEAASTIRISYGQQTQPEDIEYVCYVLAKTIKEQREL